MMQLPSHNLLSELGIVVSDLEWEDSEKPKGNPAAARSQPQVVRKEPGAGGEKAQPGTKGFLRRQAQVHESTH